MKYQVHETAIQVPMGKRDFGRRVLEVADLGSVLVVLIDPSAGGPSENVYGLDVAGNILWQVMPHEFPDGRTPYSGVNRLPDGVSLYHPTGFEVFVDPRTGRITSMKFIK